MISEIHKIYIRSAFDGFEKYYFIGTKEQLMALIGILYSTRLVKIERISYEKVSKVPEDMKQIKYNINSFGSPDVYFVDNDNNVE